MNLTDLEALCDEHGDAVIEMLVNICHEKAQHVLQYSESTALNAAWTKAARALDKVHLPY